MSQGAAKKLYRVNDLSKRRTAFCSLHVAAAALVKGCCWEAERRLAAQKPTAELEASSRRLAI